ncbi:hypothetical protein RCH46_09210 [Serratia fonticola]|uniref:hypothetical protein n=1 Tax=Serratia fonticola TaxID=47917 RepID=UPI0027FAACD2|nr:hypothetical protein [Serratia fonticola]MDQ7209000.1 hypothetical protein [Serratia fonticola]
MTTPSRNPVPSELPQDLKFNSGKIDEFVNSIINQYIDRFGSAHLTIAGITAIARSVIEQIKADGAEAVASIGWQELGDWAVSLTINNREQIVWYDNAWYKYIGELPHTIIGDSPATDGGIWSDENPSGKWVNIGDASVRGDLAKPSGAAMIGSSSGTVAENIRNCANIVSFGAEMIPADATAAFVSAYATGKPVYVPPGSWFTSNYQREKLFGDGSVYSNDAYFSDSGLRPMNSFPETGEAIVEHVKTWGNKERAAGKSLIVNNPAGRTQVSGFSDPSQYATYVNSDHVGEYIGMYGPKNQIITNAGASAYTVNSLVAPEIITGADVKIGMFIRTKHPTPFKAKIISVDFVTHKVTVDGWYAAGNTSVGQVPANGSSAIINAADKIWGQNTVIFLEPDSTALTATGYELGFQLDTAPGNPVWGFHAQNYSSTYSLNEAFRVGGLWNVGYRITGGCINGVQHDVSATSGATIYVQNLAADTWTGTALHVDTNWRKAASRLIAVTSGGVAHFSINTLGVRNVQRETVAVVSTSTTVTGLSPSVILCNNTSAITITLSSSNVITGQLQEIRANNGDVTIGSITLNQTNGRYIKFVFDGSTFIKLLQSN